MMGYNGSIARYFCETHFTCIVIVVVVYWLMKMVSMYLYKPTHTLKTPEVHHSKTPSSPRPTPHNKIYEANAPNSHSISSSSSSSSPILTSPLHNPHTTKPNITTNTTPTSKPQQCPHQTTL
ncbi:hypothetical protein Syun_031308 [Stephania yunnanensis]|uniref:Uncharacterized protein n=1 Tax=Stephania yunnanensis TaxID=152371 RepID=A0AAP0DWV0_9MAGN